MQVVLLNISTDSYAVFVTMSHVLGELRVGWGSSTYLVFASCALQRTGFLFAFLPGHLLACVVLSLHRGSLVLCMSTSWVACHFHVSYGTWVGCVMHYRVSGDGATYYQVYNMLGYGPSCAPRPLIVERRMGFLEELAAMKGGATDEIEWASGPSGIAVGLPNALFRTEVGDP
jgi:hypothetical protein